MLIARPLPSDWMHTAGHAGSSSAIKELCGTLEFAEASSPWRLMGSEPRYLTLSGALHPATLPFQFP